MTDQTCPNNCDRGIVEGRDQYGRPAVWPCEYCEAGHEMSDARECAAFDAEIVAPAERASMVVANWPLPIAETNYRAAILTINALNTAWNEAALLARLVGPIDFEAEDELYAEWYADTH